MARFMLLLRGGKLPAQSSKEKQKVVEKYTAWGDGLKKEGKYHGGDELKAGGHVVYVKDGKFVVDGPYTIKVISGYFLVEAKDLDEATEISKTCPHLEHGGIIEIREINPR